jgi:hypothetical protein
MLHGCHLFEKAPRGDEERASGKSGGEVQGRVEKELRSKTPLSTETESKWNPFISQWSLRKATGPLFLRF